MMQEAYASLIAKLTALASEKRRVIVAVDGRCGAGKTTLASQLAQELHCAVFHMDDFFLRPQQRTAERYAAAGGNVDYERFLEEVLSPLRQGASAVTYRPFSCASQCLAPPVTVEVGTLAVVEGSYSCHPALWDSYDLRVFLTVDAGEQLRRITRRGGAEKAAAFAARWIPLEEHYFSTFDIEDRCEVKIQN